MPGLGHELAQEVVQQATVAQPSHSHTIITMWVFVATSLVEAVAIAVLVYARGGWTYIATIPFVNLRQLTSLILAAVTIIGTGTIGYLSGVWPPEYIFHGALVALSVWMGFDVGAYWIKRATTDPTIASTQNVMAAQAATGQRVDARDARAAADPGARQPVPTGEHEAVTKAKASPRPLLTDDDDGVA